MPAGKSQPRARRGRGRWGRFPRPRNPARVLADTDRAQITFTDGQFAVSVPGRWATGRILDGRLPDYPFPSEDDFESTVTVSTEALADAIKHVQPLLGKSDPIVLDISDDRITVRADTDDKGRDSDQVDATLTGPPLGTGPKRLPGSKNRRPATRYDVGKTVERPETLKTIGKPGRSW